MNGINVNNYPSREELVLTTITKDEAIRRIHKYGAEYNSTTSHFDVYDQLLACEAINESTPVSEDYHPKQQEWNGNSNWNANDSRNHKEIFDISQRKLEIVTELKRCTYRTSPVTISCLLEKFFEGQNTFSGHWFYIAEKWPPKAINSAMNRLLKLLSPGHVTIRSPAKYFTSLVKRRSRRKLPEAEKTFYINGS